jgi:hypothetical protein
MVSVTGTVEGTRETGRPCKIWREDVEDDLNITEKKTGVQWSETVRNGG